MTTPPSSRSEPDTSRPDDLPVDVIAAIARLATVPVLLVSSDFDGTISPIAIDPDHAHPLPAAVDALTELAQLPRTHVALVSGRALDDLARRAALPSSVHLVGSHGWESQAWATTVLDPAAQERRRLIAVAGHRVAAQFAGVHVEEKPATVAIHYRTVDVEHKPAVQAAIAAGPGQLDGVHALHGKEVVEFSVVETTKGTALARLRHQLGADAVIFVGDDTTDELAFAVLGDTDVGVKVGPGDSQAAWRVDDPAAVAVLFGELATQRARRVG